MKAWFQKLLNIVKEDVLLKRVLRNTSYLFSSQAIGMVLAMGQSVLATHLLGASLFGLLAVVMTFATNVNRLFSFRMGEFVIQFMGKELVKKDSLKAAAVAKAALLTESITSVLTYGIFLLIIPIGTNLFAKNPTTSSLFQVYGLFILANLCNESATGILQITNRYKIQAAINLTQSIVTAGLIGLAFLLHGSILFVLWAYLIGKFIIGLGSVIAALIALHQKLGRDWWKAPFSIFPSIKEMVAFTVSTNLSGTVKMLVSGSEPLLIGFLLDTQAVALYKIATSITEPLMIPISQFINTTFPEMTRSIVQRKWKELRTLLRRVTLISGVWTLLFSLGMLVLGPWILSIWGQKYVAAYPTMMILLVGYGISNIFYWNRTLLLSFGKANIPLYVLFAGAVIKTALAFVVVPPFGMAAEAWLLSGNFAITVGLMVAIGYSLIRKNERLDQQKAETVA